MGTRHFHRRKKFNLKGPDGFSKIWALDHKNYNQYTRKNQTASSVMIWASFSVRGVIDIQFIDRRLNPPKYIKLLQLQAFTKFENIYSTRGSLYYNRITLLVTYRSTQPIILEKQKSRF